MPAGAREVEGIENAEISDLDLKELRNAGSEHVWGLDHGQIDEFMISLRLKCEVVRAKEQHSICSAVQ